MSGIVVIHEVPEGVATISIEKVDEFPIITIGITDETVTKAGFTAICLDGKGAIALYAALGERIKEIYE